MNTLKEYKQYVLKKKNEDKLRIAIFNGFGVNKGWGGMDWSGDTGYSTDSWMHDEVEWYVGVDIAEQTLFEKYKLSQQ